MYFFQDLKKVSCVFVLAKCTYMYEQMLKSSWLTALVVFLVSSFMHDYHIAAATGYFLPVFMVLFTGAGGT